jgi:exopolyphosphatase/guanosine-5'-triphosphate,3'-diphosphate pyrophosphatase
VNLATIDVGTNTTLLLVARTGHTGTAGPTVEALEERAEITRLGRGIGREGALDPHAIARTLGVLRDFAAIAQGHGARIAAVGTEALRRAPNAAAFLRPAAEILGTHIDVIDGEREAALTFRAVIASFADLGAGELAVVDIGGGSTEIVLAANGAVRFRTSLPLGSVRLTEAFVRHDPAGGDERASIAAAVDAAIAAVPWSQGPTTLVGVAGTVTSLAAMALGLASYDPARVHGYRLSRADLGREVERLAASTQAEREKMIGLDPRRADVILAGALILDRIAAAAGVTDIRVSDRGIRWGLAHELAAAHGRGA